MNQLRAIGMVALIFSPLSDLFADLRSFDHRYLWVVRNTLTSQQSIDDMIEFSVENGFNHLLIQVRGRGDAYYRSKLVPRSELLRNNVFDPLDYVIRRAHSNGIQVHAWVNVYLVWSSKNPPKAMNHVVNTHPEWVDQNGDKSSTSVEGIEIVGEGIYLAPHHPDVNNHLLAIFRELVALYDLDGLHLDYIRFHDVDYGNNKKAKSLYDKLRKQKGRISKNDNENWNDYRRSSVTNLIKETKRMLLDIRPNCKLSAAVKPNLAVAKKRFYQEWDGWLATGYLNNVMPMNYTPDLREFAKNIDILYENLPEKYRNKIVMGIALYNQSPLDAADKIKYSEITRFKGISLFSYNILNDKHLYRNELFKVLNR